MAQRHFIFQIRGFCRRQTPHRPHVACQFGRGTLKWWRATRFSRLLRVWLPLYSVLGERLPTVSREIPTYCVHYHRIADDPAKTHVELPPMFASRIRRFTPTVPKASSIASSTAGSVGKYNILNLISIPLVHFLCTTLIKSILLFSAMVPRSFRYSSP
ncbi:uncharacterized protein B0T23DRAFT_185697 [Neurospora hispaniola]|uniref:Uncharacterized protein n=1 Tax=Neurospora hispaniola TaxID=588809 RepID=A0AAJ0I320_9PEZI|nr:hypothetical protein B0T23DRAFT_185697 [Neurospora hispaniola]